MSDAETVQVLVVDDDPSVRALCRRLLEQQDYRVREAADGREAIDRVAQELPYVIVMDVAMPRMDGLECTRLLKAHPLTRDIPVIMASIRSQAADVIAGLEAGADEYIAKPIQPREFILRVRSMVRLQLSRIELLRSNKVRGEQAHLLTLLLDFCRGLAEAETLDAILEHTVSTAAAATASRRVSIMLPDEHGEYLRIAKAIGIDPEIAASVRVPLGEPISGQVFRSRDAVVINTEKEAKISHYDYDSQIFASVPMACTALGTWENVVGVMNLTERWAKGPFTPAELEYIDLISNIAASAIHDYTSRQARDEARDSIVVALASLAKRRDVETGKHLERVTRFSFMLAKGLRSSPDCAALIDDEFLRDLARAVPLHDIGKVALPDHILLKPGKLTTAEMTIMKTHAQIGAATIRAVATRAPGVPFLAMAEQVARSHHERFDGSGYPDGLAGEDIPLCARIVALADVYDALTSKRVYKTAHSHEQAVAILLGAAGTQFDPAIVAAFLRCQRDFAQSARQLADEPAASDDARPVGVPTPADGTPDLVMPQLG